MVPNQGAGAASMRVECAPAVSIDLVQRHDDQNPAATPSAGAHEKRSDDDRNIGLEAQSRIGSSHGSDAVGP